MTNVNRILSDIENGDGQAAEDILPLVYEELRRLAAQKISNEKPGQTLDATALVHEAYLRLVHRAKGRRWNGRGHFFAAAAEAMRRILVEHTRRRLSIRHGGELRRQELGDFPQSAGAEPEMILAIDEAIARLAENDAQAARIVKLHVFTGMTLDQTALALGTSRATVYREWAYARAVLRLALEEHDRASRARKNSSEI